MKKNRMRAVIDIGSHSIRMYIGEIVRKGVVRQLDHLWIPIAIGNDTFTQGLVKNGTITEVINILRNFKDVLESYGVKSYKAIATSSIRDASNAETFIERVLNATGIDIKIIQPIDEVLFLYKGLTGIVKDRYGFLKKNILIFSLGAGSTQIVFQSQGKVHFSNTRNEGTLRVIRNFDLPFQSLETLLTNIAEGFYSMIFRYQSTPKIDRFISINDDLLALIKKIFTTNEVKGVVRIPAEDFMGFFQKTRKMSVVEMGEKYSLGENAIISTRIAVFITAHLFSMTGAKEIIFPEVSMPAAVLERLSYTEADEGLGFSHDFREHILSAARVLAKKYAYNEKETERVYYIATNIFDALRDVYNFSEQEKLYLEAACILHNIGYFISGKSHHKHSASLIASSEILGLSQNEMKIIAQIARYHRRAVPRSSHSEFNKLLKTEKIIVQRMAAILRVAVALAEVAALKVEDVGVHLENDYCQLLVKLKNKKYECLDVLRLLVKKNSVLFENFFGLPLRVDRLNN